MPLYYSECCILCNRHLHLTEQSLILAVAVMFSLHVYLQIDVRNVYILVIHYYVTTVLFTYPWVIGLENEYLDDWDTGKNLFLAVRSLKCCSDATRTEVYSRVRIYTMCIVNLKLPSSLCSQIIH